MLAVGGRQDAKVYKLNQRKKCYDAAGGGKFLQTSHIFAVVWPLLLEYCIQYFKFHYFCPIYGFGLSNQWLWAVKHGFPFSNLYFEGLADQLLKDRISDMLLAQRKSILGLLDTVVRGVANPNLQSLILFIETNLKMLPLMGNNLFWSNKLNILNWRPYVTISMLFYDCAFKCNMYEPYHRVQQIPTWKDCSAFRRSGHRPPRVSVLFVTCHCFCKNGHYTAHRAVVRSVSSY